MLGGSWDVKADVAAAPALSEKHTAATRTSTATPPEGTLLSALDSATLDSMEHGPRNR
jgi:hypothetical protein